MGIYGERLTAVWGLSRVHPPPGPGLLISGIKWEYCPGFYFAMQSLPSSFEKASSSYTGLSLTDRLTLSLHVKITANCKTTKCFYKPFAIHIYITYMYNV